MAQALYRKYRPQTFGDLAGQDAIRDTLAYALTHDHVSHAYLLCGPRGTGKTTVARLIAKTVNCAADGQRPCNQCPSCLSITDGTNLDIVEIDAASNRGIDEIRQLRDAVRFAPTQAKYKVFIIDEVHMLTREAFNALLKTLEEPPVQTIFIMATTEANKVPPTIVSRCQRYDFRLAPLDVLVERLAKVAESEGMVLTPEAATFMARLADGSFRDGLSLLEQIKGANVEKLDLVTVEKLFGFVAVEQLSRLLALILAGQIGEAHQEIDAVLARGADLKAFLEQLITLSQSALEAAALGDFSDIDSQLGEAAKTLTIEQLVVWIELLLQAMREAKQMPMPRLALDVAVAKFSTVVSAKPTRVAAAVPIAVKEPPAPAAKVEAKSTVVAKAEVETKPEVQVEAETVKVPVAEAVIEPIDPDKWQAVLTNLKEETPALVTSLARAKLMRLDENQLTVAVRFKMHADKINQTKNRGLIEAALRQATGEPITVLAEIVKDLPIEEESVDLSQVFEFED